MKEIRYLNYRCLNFNELKYMVEYFKKLDYNTKTVIDGFPYTYPAILRIEYGKLYVFFDDPHMKNVISIKHIIRQQKLKKIT